GIHQMLPGLEKGILHTVTLPEMPFVDTFFAMAFTLNQGVIPSSWTFSNVHKHKYLKASEVALKYPNHIPDEALYQYGLEICLLANKVNFNLGKVKYLSKKITETYESLPVKSELDLALTSNDILNVLNKKPGAWFGQLKKEMVLEILRSEE